MWHRMSQIQKGQVKREISVILINGMNMDDIKAERGLWNFKNNGHSRVKQVCGTIAGLVIVFITLKMQRPNDIKLLKKPLTVKGIRMVLDPAKRKDSIEGKFDDENNLVLCEVVLSTRSIYGREYKLVDSPEDGFFPNDADDLVDKVSKRDPFRRRSRWSKRRYSRTPWKTIPFEAELYQIATGRYKKAAAIINSFEGSELGIIIDE